MCGAQVNTQENALIWESSGSIIAKNSNLAALESFLITFVLKCNLL